MRNYTQVIDSRLLFTWLRFRSTQRLACGTIVGLSGLSDRVDKLMNDPIDVMKQSAVAIVDPADIPTHGKFDDSELVACFNKIASTDSV